MGDGGKRGEFAKPLPSTGKEGRDLERWEGLRQVGLYGTRDRSWAEHTLSLAGIALPQMSGETPRADRQRAGSVQAVCRQQRAIL